MAGDALIFKQDFDRAVCHPDIDLLPR